MFCFGRIEVGNYLRLFRGSLYKKYPGMFRRIMTSEERKKLAELGLNQHVLASNISLLRAQEVDDVIEGREDKYRAVSVQTLEPQFPKWVTRFQCCDPRDPRIPRLKAVSWNRQGPEGSAQEHPVGAGHPQQFAPRRRTAGHVHQPQPRRTQESAHFPALVSSSTLAQIQMFLSLMQITRVLLN